jgi:hypothetical protein
MFPDADDIEETTANPFNPPTQTFKYKLLIKPYILLPFKLKGRGR